MKNKSLLLLLSFFLFVCLLSAQTNILFRPALHFTMSPPARIIKDDLGRYSSKVDIDLGADIAFYLDFEKNKWGITTGFINSTIANPHTFNYSGGSKATRVVYHNVYHIPILLQYKWKKVYTNFLSFAKFMDINFSTGPSIELINYNYTDSDGVDLSGFSVGGNSYDLVRNTQEQFLRKVNTSFNFNLGFQFHGKERPTFRVDIFYRQGLNDFLETNIDTQFNSQVNGVNTQQSGITTLRTRGSIFGFNVSYAFKLYSNSPLIPRGASDLDITKRKDGIYPSIYIRPTIGNFSFIGRIIDNPSNRYKNANSIADGMIGSFFDINLSKRWALTTGFFGANIGTSQKLSHDKTEEFLTQIGVPSFHIPFYARLQTNKLNFNSFFRYLSLETFAGSSIDFLTNSSSFTENIIDINPFVTPNVNINQTQNITIKNKVNLSLVTGIGIQFYGKYRPTFKLEVFYRQGLGDMLENKIVTNLNNETYQATYRTRGSGVGFNLSYPFKLWEKNKKVN